MLHLGGAHLSAEGAEGGAGVGVMYFLIIICAGVNFLIELAINVIVAPAIHTVVRVLEKRA